MYEITIGRSDQKKRELGLKGTIFLGKHYVKMGQTTSLSNKVMLDVSTPHVILVSGKRGSGKSYSLGVIAEGMLDLPREISEKLSILIFDTMGIYWTMKYPNEKDEDLLQEWGLKKKGVNVDIYVPQGYFDKYKETQIPVDYPFSISPSELTSLDWCNIFDIEINSSLGILIERILSKLNKEEVTIENILNEIKQDLKTEQKVKLALENRFLAAKAWGIFSDKSTPLKQIVDNAKTTVLDISCYENWNIKCLVVSLICKKLIEERMLIRKKEELEDVQTGHSYFGLQIEKKSEEMPLVWILIDEAHEFLKKDSTTPATESLVKILREGRQPGISLVLATQQPGEIHRDVITQTDIVLSHRITAKKDISALNDMMQSYLPGDIMKYLNLLPKENGAAIILDDNSERLYPLRVRPRFTWHGGESPSAVKVKGKALEQLKL